MPPAGHDRQRDRVGPRLGRRAGAVRRPRGRRRRALARISDATAARIQDALDPGLRRGEPTGRVGTGIDHERIFESFEALHADLDTAAVAFVADPTRQGSPTRGLPVGRGGRVRPHRQAVLRRRTWRARSPPRRRRSFATAASPSSRGPRPAARALRHLLDDRAVRAASGQARRSPSAGGRGQGAMACPADERGAPCRRGRGLEPSLPTAFPG